MDISCRIKVASKITGSKMNIFMNGTGDNRVTIWGKRKLGPYLT